MSVETTQQAVAGVYTLLRRPSQQKLPKADVKERLQDVLRGYMQDLNLGRREHRTQTAIVTLTREDDDGYSIDLPNVPDFEPVELEFSPGYYANSIAWQRVVIGSREGWERRYASLPVFGSFYGSDDLGGQRIKLNIDPAEYVNAQWRLTYRTPLLSIVQLGAKLPLPSNFLTMIRLETALACVPIVNDDSEGWEKWCRTKVPFYVAQLSEWKNGEGTGRWQKYLQESREPALQEMRRYDQFRARRRGRNPRAYLPIGSG